MKTNYSFLNLDNEMNPFITENARRKRRLTIEVNHAESVI